MHPKFVSLPLYFLILKLQCCWFYQSSLIYALWSFLGIAFVEVATTTMRTHVQYGKNKYYRLLNRFQTIKVLLQRLSLYWVQTRRVWVIQRIRLGRVWLITVLTEISFAVQLKRRWTTRTWSDYTTSLTSPSARIRSRSTSSSRLWLRTKWSS